MYEKVSMEDGGKRISGRYVVKDGMVTATASNGRVTRRLDGSSGRHVDTAGLEIGEAKQYPEGPFNRSIKKERRVQVLVRDNNVDRALKVLKKKTQREGVFREMKLRNQRKALRSHLKIRDQAALGTGAGTELGVNHPSRHSLRLSAFGPSVRNAFPCCIS